jgi:hypothetical protein
MGRQRAINDYEEAQHKKLKEFEAATAKENASIQTDLDRANSAYMTRIQANLDELARQEDSLRAWKKQKQVESELIAEAAAFCAPHNTTLHGGSLTAMLASVAPRR